MHTKECTVADCTRPVLAKGFCTMHYRRVRATGSTGLRKRPSMAERFWAKVEKTDTCWLWTAFKDHNGYGKFSDVNGQSQKYAHRVALTLSGVQIPPGHQVDHMCFVHACVNPDHLQVVTQQQNGENRRAATAASKTGVRGVHWVSNVRKYRAACRVQGVAYYGGLFLTVEEAEAAVIELRNSVMSNNLVDRRSA